MSIQTEINRIAAAKSVIKEWLESEDVTVDDGATITAIAEIISSLKLEDGNMGGYGICSTAAGTVAKTVTVDSDSFTLKTGACVRVKFTNSNTASSPTLNVNGTGAKAIKRYGTTAPSTSAASSWNAGSVIDLTYDGTYWVMHNFLNTTYSSMTVAEYEAGEGTTARIITPARLKAAILTWASGKDHTHGAACEKGVDTTVTSGSSNLVTSGGVYTALANASASGGITMKKLWENASPTSSFAAQTISLDLSEYEKVLIEYNGHISWNLYSSVICTVGKTCYGNLSAGNTGFQSGTVAYTVNRSFTINTTGVVCTGGWAITSNGSTVSNESRVCVPYRIYGIKGVI